MPDRTAVLLACHSGIKAYVADSDKRAVIASSNLWDHLWASFSAVFLHMTFETLLGVEWSWPQELSVWI